MPSPAVPGVRKAKHILCLGLSLALRDLASSLKFWIKEEINTCLLVHVHTFRGNEARGGIQRGKRANPEKCCVLSQL